MTTTKLPGDAEHRYEWDASGAVKSFTDPDSETTGAVTDLLGRPLSRTYPDGTVETIEYEGVRIKSVTDRQGRKQSYDYNAKGQLVAIRDAGGTLLDELRYDKAGRLERWTNRDSSLFYGEFDLHGNPGRTVQTRYRNGSAFDPAPEVLDEYVQEHDWNGYGERTRFTMPAYPSMPSSSGRWTRSLALEYDALGNVTRVRKNDSTDLMTASYRSAGRPDVRTIHTASGAALERRYEYDASNGLQTATEVYSGDQLLAGTRVVEYDGLQKRELQHLGVSGGKRGSRFSYDGRSRLENALIGGDLSLVPAAEILTKSDFRTEVARTPPTPVSLETQTATEHPSKGHKLGTLTRDGETSSYAYDGSERSEDDRFVYRWDHKGRLVSVTEKPPAPGATIRRIVYAYDGNDRLVGRTSQMAAATTVGVPLDALAWTVETRPAILTADGLPAETTFVWDPISDQLASIFRAGASKNPTIDSEGGLLRQILHGQLSYDDPIEVTARSEGVILSAAKDPLPSATSDVITLYPLYDESGTGSLQAIFDENARLVARSFAEDAYGDGESFLLGGAVDGVTVRAKKDAGGALSSVDVAISTTEPIISATLIAGSRLAVVDAAGTVVRTSSNSPTFADSNTIQWTLTDAEWNALIASPAASLSIAVTENLRFTGWTDTAPMPAPDWALATQPVYTSPTLPVEVREPLATLAAWLASLPANADEARTLYQVQSLPALGAPPTLGSNAARLQQLITSANFHAHPFTEPLTAQNYVRARWYETETGTWLSPDPMGYQDSSTLFAFCGRDPVNCSDPRGEQARPSVRSPQPRHLRPARPGLRALRPPKLQPPPAPPPGATLEDKLAWARMVRQYEDAIAVESRRTAGVLQIGRPGILDDPVQQARFEWMILNGYLPKMPGVTPHSQQAQLFPAAASQLTQYHNEEVLGAEASGPALITEVIPQTSVWLLSPRMRGRVIEDDLAASEYSDWFRAGRLDHGYFPLIDFQKGQNLVSLKTVDPRGSGALIRLEAHIDALAESGALVNGRPASMFLDVRVPPGLEGELTSLSAYGANVGVIVRVKSYERK